MPHWKGIIARSFDVDGFTDYVNNEVMQYLASWTPEFVVLHNTQIPRLDQWHDVPGLQRMRGLESFYRDEQKWSGGPHLFVADDLIWAFTPLWVPGVHSPSWNDVSWGVETVGDYDKEELPQNVFDNVIGALAALHVAIGQPANTLRFHKEDPATTHRGCPGRNIVKQEVVDALASALGAV
jgi:hypothetical protein